MFSQATAYAVSKTLPSQVQQLPLEGSCRDLCQGQTTHTDLEQQHLAAGLTANWGHGPLPGRRSWLPCSEPHSTVTVYWQLPCGAAFQSQDWGALQTANPQGLCKCGCLEHLCLATPSPIYTHLLILLSFQTFSSPFHPKWLFTTRSWAAFDNAQGPLQGAQSSYREHPQDLWAEWRQEGREQALKPLSCVCCPLCTQDLLRVAERHHLSSSLLNGSQSIEANFFSYPISFREGEKYNLCCW